MNNVLDSAASPAPVAHRWKVVLRDLRPLRWVGGYQPGWAAADLVAGLTLAAYAIPVAMAYAGLARLPPEHGIYCYVFGGLLYALFGSSRQLAIGPTSAIAMLVGASVGAIAGDLPDIGRLISIAALTAIMVAVISVIAWLVRLSQLVNFISETILVGFKAGAALTIAMTQLPKLFGVPGGGDGFFERAWTLATQLGETNLVVLGLGLVALTILLVGDRYRPQWPIPLLVVALATMAVSLFGLKRFDVSTVGILPAGLPAIGLPDLRLSDVDGVIPLAVACFLLSYIESISAARTLAAAAGEEVNPRQELLALAAANLAAGLGQGLPVAGGLSQSAVNQKAGARSPLSLIFASCALVVCLLFFTSLLQDLPNVVLAAIVLVAVKGLINVTALRRLWALSKGEFQISMVALVGVLALGILKGVLLAAIASLLMLLAAAARPHVAFIGRIPGTRLYSDRARHPDNEVLPGLLVFRVEAALLYFNIEHVREMVWRRAQETPDLRLVICDLSATPVLDVAGARFIYALHQRLAQRGVALRVVDAHGAIRDLLRAEGLEQQLGYFGRRLTLDQIIAQFESEPGLAASAPEHTTETKLSTTESS